MPRGRPAKIYLIRSSRAPHIWAADDEWEAKAAIVDGFVQVDHKTYQAKVKEIERKADEDKKRAARLASADRMRQSISDK